MNIPLPNVVADLNDELTMRVLDALEQRTHSTALLAAARGAVATAIEENEDAALNRVKTLAASGE
jgi:hypothetical protein